MLEKGWRTDQTWRGCESVNALVVKLTAKSVPKFFSSFLDFDLIVIPTNDGMADDW